MTRRRKMSWVDQHPFLRVWNQDTVRVARRKGTREVNHQGGIQDWASRKAVNTE